MSNMTPAQESWIESEYDDFFAALSQEKLEECRDVIKTVQAKEFWKVADDMSKILASKKLHS